MRTVVARLLFPLVAAAFGAGPAVAEKGAAPLRVAYLSSSTGSDVGKAALDEFKKVLRDRGYREGDNLVIDVRWAGGNVERFPALAEELVSLKPNVIVTITTPVTAAARKATSTIPIVMAFVSDPVGEGFIASMAKPGGNVTGVMDYGIELGSKFIEQARELSPTSRAVGVLTADNPAHHMQLEKMRVVAPGGPSVLPLMGRSPEEIDAAFTTAAEQGAKVMIVLGGPPQSGLRDVIAESALRHKLATIAPQRPYVEAGCLMSYGPPWFVQYRMAADFVARILAGKRPGELPVEQPVNIELVINLKTAKGLRMKIPPALSQRADAIIE